MEYIEKLKNIRKQNNLSQRDIAAIFRVNHGTIALWETGSRSIPGPAKVLIDHFKIIIKKFKENSKK